MFNKEEILKTVHYGQPLPTWRVIHPQSAYFIKTMLVCICLAVLFVGGAFYMNYSHSVFVPGYSSDPLSSDDFHLWQIIDYITIGVFACAAIGGFFAGAIDMKNAKKQLLILTPEGFIIQTSRSIQAVAYAEVVSMNAKAHNRSSIRLIIKTSSGGKDRNIVFDGRFGDSRSITSSIINTQRYYATAVRQA